MRGIKAGACVAVLVMVGTAYGSTRPAGEAGAGAAAAEAPRLHDRTPTSHQWDRPAGRYTLETTLARAKADGALPFDVPVPRITASPAFVHVADPAKVPADRRSLFIAYRFPTGPEFPADGRVVLSVVKTDATPATLRTMADQNTPAEAYVMVDVAGQQALLIQNDEGTVGWVLVVRDGFMYALGGPALSPAAAVKYAALLVPLGA